MENIQYLGEHLAPGYFGHLAVLIAFVAALLSAFAYYNAQTSENTTTNGNWYLIGRLSYLLHTFSVFFVVGLVFFMMTNKYYEYSYVQAHVSDELPFKYIFSAFWEGQEGSFLLWMVWHGVLGMILILKRDQFEAPVMFTIAAVEVVLVSMILGIYITPDQKIGSSVFTLLRETMNIPLFQNKDYVSLLQGTGLNPLLQNYWMTIHPPTLFLGFASTVVPFAYAIAGLWTGKHREWLKPVLPWALFSGGILGTGILMGSAWAYEALSFGGYWAWDPVENSSLVPWLILIAGLHTNLISKKTGHSIRATYIFYLLGFVLIVYSTLLTRSGWLGDTSVHAFTEMGLEAQLVFFNAFFFLLGFILLAVKWRQIPSPKKEEALDSKEFWMFIGSLVFLFSSILILYSTSLPLMNQIVQLFDENYPGKVITEPIPHYNKYQIWVAILISILTSVAQYFRYRPVSKGSYLKKVGKQVAISLAISLVLSFVINLWLDLQVIPYMLILFFSVFAIYSNVDVLLKKGKSDTSVWTGAVSHIGFAVMLIGILGSGVNKKYISTNPFSQKGLVSDENLGTNVVLFEGEPNYMQGYEVEYVGDTLIENMRYFELFFAKLDPNTAEVVDSFRLYPTGQYNKEFTKVATFNPDTKHGLTKDIFAFINIPTIKADIEAYQAQEDSLNYRPITLNFGDNPVLVDTFISDQRVQIDSFAFTIQNINLPPKSTEYEVQKGDIAIGIEMAVNDHKKRDRTIEPVIIVRDGLIYHQSAQVDDFSMKVKISDINLDKLLSPDIEYETIDLKTGESFEKNNTKFSFKGFRKNPDKQGFSIEEDDLLAQADLDVELTDGRKFSLEPVYLIRDNRPFSIEDRVWKEGIYAKVLKINPSDESVTLQVAKTEAPRDIVFEIATNSFRSDFVVLEAIEFPGINLFWIGTILLLTGLFLAWGARLKKNKEIRSDAWR